MMAGDDFWSRLDQLISNKEVIIDRPQGTPHPRHSSFVYPLDYGYLEGTRAVDGSGIDVWLGSEAGRRITGVVCTVDLAQQNAEIKLLVSCSQEERRLILGIHNYGAQSAILIERPQKGHGT